MSMPSFPPNGADMTREEALTMIIASIAMEELALSHKVFYVLFWRFLHPDLSGRSVVPQIVVRRGSDAGTAARRQKKKSRRTAQLVTPGNDGF